VVVGECDERARARARAARGGAFFSQLALPMDTQLMAAAPDTAARATSRAMRERMVARGG
jgi:hypothetical protein